MFKDSLLEFDTGPFCVWERVLPLTIWLCCRSRLKDRCARMVRAGAQEFKKAFEEAMTHNEKLLAEDEAAAESRGEETPAEAAARESSAKVSVCENLVRVGSRVFAASSQGVLLGGSRSEVPRTGLPHPLTVCAASIKGGAAGDMLHRHTPAWWLLWQ